MIKETLEKSTQVKIAIVDDEKNVRLALRKYLENEGFQIMEFSNGQAALDDLKANNIPDLYLLDIMMPVMDGILFLKEYKELHPDLPSIFLTSRDEEFDKILGLELGADDYLTKPFSMKELTARIKVILRRYKKRPLEANISEDKDLIKSQNLELNTRNCIVKIIQSNQAKEIPLTVTEFRLLEHFMKTPDTIFSREDLIKIAYPEDIYLNDRAIDCHIKRLRKKLGSDCISTIYGMGYKFAEK